MAIKVLVIDEHGIYRRGVKEILEDNEDIRVTGEAQNLSAALDPSFPGTWDVVLLTVDVPGVVGLEALRKIKTHWSSAAVLILSSYAEEHFAIRVLKGGAAGYLTKESAPKDLIDAVRKVSTGGKYIPSSLAEALAQNLDSRSVKPKHFYLSEREFQVFCLLGKGISVKQVSTQLALSDKTVSTYRQRVLDKMQMTSTMQIVRYVIEHRIEQSLTGDIPASRTLQDAALSSSERSGKVSA